ncbi:TPA: hypothetical protein DCW54_03180 [Candidatus Dependentiae bacterium]|nr:hypothetical protein [Candidatus Dependentiae bacterium]
MKQALHQFRISLVVALFFVFFLVALVHLFITQILHHDFYADLGRRQYHIQITQQPARGNFFDRNHAPLTLNQESYSLFITPNQMEQPEQTKHFILKYFPEQSERFITGQNTPFAFIKRHLTPEEHTLVLNTKLVDLHLLKEHKRVYLAPSLAHTIGITDVDNKGLTGLEMIYENKLAGIPTTYILQKDARIESFYFEKTAAQEGCEGTDISLTIDQNIQEIVYHELKKWVNLWKAQEGMILVTNPQDGAIIASAMYPDSNPNKPSSIEQQHLKNRCFTESYELGSVIKVFSALAALEDGVVTPEETIDCRNTKETTINGIRVTTWKAGGLLTFTDVIRQSNNIGTSLIALRLGKKLYHYLTKYGFAQKTDLQFPGEAVGGITPLKQWSKATPLSLSFGYEIRASTLQLATALGMIANNGILVAPRLLSTSPIVKKEVASAEAVAQLRTIITINKETSPYHKAQVPGYVVQGKTGTAHLLSNGQYDPARNIYTFAGIIEQGSYQRVITIIIKEPYKETQTNLYAASVAAPLFNKIAQQIVVIEKIPPHQQK